jgi:biopolymer transport protein ExbD
MRHATGVTLAVSSLLFLGCTPQKPSAGISVALLRRGPNPFPGSTDGDGLYIMTIESKRVARVRGEHIRFENLGNRLEEVFRTRSERLLLVRVEGQVEFGDVIEVLDRASSGVQLQYGLMTERSTPTPAEPCLFMGGELIFTQYFLPPEPMPLSRRRARH